MSNIDKQALRERYSPQPVPKCHICGAEMTIQRMSASRITYGCTGATYDDAGCHYTVGRSIADDHYEQSRVTVVDVSDPDVLALLDELEAKDKQIAEHSFENRLLANADRDIKALRQRIAELEAHQYLPQPLNIKDEYQNYEYVSGWNDCRNAASVREHTAAIRDVIAERYRQQSVEGWTPEHDDEHCNNEMAMAAVCYINETGTVNRNGGKPWGWPWDASWWKPNARRRNLVKAGALILAEIERIDRAAGIGKGD